MNGKRKGTRNEHRSIALLEAAGYSVIRAAGSFGIWDLVAIGRSDAVLVQVKTRDYPSTLQVELLKEFVCPDNFRKIIHRWRDRCRLPDVKQL